MPRELRIDSAKHIYCKAFTEGPVFNNESPLLNSFIEFMQIETHEPADYVRIQTGTLMIVLEGEAAIVNQDASRIGIMRAGSHFIRRKGKMYYLVPVK